MRNLLLLPLLLMLVSPGQNSAPSPDGPAVTVLGFKCSRSRQILEKLAPASVTPAPAMIPANKNYARNARINDPAGAQDPNTETIDGRSAAIDRIEREARTVPAKAVDGFSYRAKVQNTRARAIEILFWEYQFIDLASPATMTRRQFLCGVSVKPNKAFELQAFTLSGPRDVVSVDNLANKSDNVFQEKVVINRVEYSDGSIWQRKDWNFAEIGPSYKRAIGSPWGTEMCRAL
jgi:hypothetical protein